MATVSPEWEVDNRDSHLNHITQVRKNKTECQVLI